MKKDKPKKAPKVAPPSIKKPNFMKESDKGPERKSPMAPMVNKRLSK